MELNGEPHRLERRNDGLGRVSNSYVVKVVMTVCAGDWYALRCPGLKAEEEYAVGSERPSKLAGDGRELMLGSVDDRVPRDDASQGPIGIVELLKCANAKGYVGMTPPGLGDHAGGKIEARDIDTALDEIACDAAGSASGIDDGAGNTGGEVIKKVSMQGTRSKFCVQEFGVVRRDAIVGDARALMVRRRHPFILRCERVRHALHQDVSNR